MALIDRTDQTITFNGTDISHHVVAVLVTTTALTAVLEEATSRMRTLTRHDETHGMTVDELIPEIDRVLGDYRSVER